jgi:uncharacterized membrane protein
MADAERQLLIVAFPIHIVAIIVWLGSLFMLVSVVGPTTRALDAAASASLWHRLLSRFFLWGSTSLAIIVATGIVIGPVRFGGFSNVPELHRWNMIIGLPAIALFAYAHLGPYRAFGRAIADRDWNAAGQRVARIRALLGTVLILGLVASVVSAVARFV